MNVVLFMCASLAVLTVAENELNCIPSETTATGTFAPKKICSGDLIFSDEFEKFNFKKWEHENTLAGGGNWEFQWYTNNRSNSFVEDGKLFIKPTLTNDTFSNEFLYKGTIDLNGGSPVDQCTNPTYWGCSRTGTRTNILNPVKSAKIRTFHSFSFCYGRVQVRTKLPTGDWLWPAIWMMPRDNAYGLRWPTSGEVDIIEGRGNLNLTLNDTNIGVQKISSTLHWGPEPSQNKYANTSWDKNNMDGYNENFHVFELIWSPDNITFSVDDEEYGTITPPMGGFWEMGNFSSLGYDNPWKGATEMAPFDQEFYFIINLAVGGVSFFPDKATNPAKKPWENKSNKAFTEFWDYREEWLPTWNLQESNDAALQVDYIRVYAL